MSFPFDHIIDVKKYLTKLRVDYWYSNSFMSIEWFCLLAILIISWLIGLKLLNKKKSTAVILFGLLMILIFDFLDQLGVMFNLWDYRIEIAPLPTGLLAINYAFAPVSSMLIYQYFPDWKRFLLYSILLSLAGSAIIEPLLEVYKIYIIINWEHYYSFPIYIAITAIDKTIVDYLDQLRLKA